jgi:hypothetical protein
MVSKTSSVTILCVALLLVISGGISQTAFAQDTISVQATPLYRFITQNATLGHFLTSNYSEGSCCPYNYAYQPFPYEADIVPVVPGYTPRDGQGLLPLYRWQVDQRPRIYYYYSIYYANHGSGYTYQGVAGYVLPNSGAFGGTPLNYWYSQSYGFYYTLNGEYPPCCTFSYQGVQYNLPVGGTYLFDKIPEPPDPCPGMDADRQDCAINGGTWDDSTCSCQYNCLYYCNVY